jgi:hypothetical protein
MWRSAILILTIVSTGCVQRSMTIDTTPTGALVYLNGEEAGRTPFEKDFTWYGTYDVVVRKEGYETLRVKQKVNAPWWQWPPFDLVAELFTVKDQRNFNYTMNAAADSAIDLDAILTRSGELESQLQSSRVPSTRPAQP